MNKENVTRIIEEIAAYLELKGESSSLPSVQDIASELTSQGSSQTLERLRQEFPPGLVEMFQIPGLGATKIRQIYQRLQIDSLAELENAARDGRLAGLPRFGKKTAAKVLTSIEQLRRNTEPRLFHHARREAEELAAILAGIPGVARVEIAGTVRRRMEIIRGLDFVVQLKGSPHALIQRLDAVPGVSEFVAETDTALSLRFESGTAADIHWTSAAQFGFQLLRATGSEEHLAQLRRLAQGRSLSWSDRGLAKNTSLVKTPTELAVYAALDLPYIEPELREGRGEVEAARSGKLPVLIEHSDIRGFLHCHSTYSDGTSTVTEWARACRDAGYEYLGITDHSERATYAGGISEDQLRLQHSEIDAVNKRQSTFRVLKGIEADILEDGSLDLVPETTATFEFVIASVHSRLEMNASRMTARILKAMEDPRMTILGHPTGRLLLSRNSYPMDTQKIFERAAELGVAIEINADPQRLDLDWRLLREAVDTGVTISIGADAHHVHGMLNMDIGIGIARKGWISKEHVLNTRPVDEFLDHSGARMSAPR